jgi:hypothetical protein
MKKLLIGLVVLGMAAAASADVILGFDLTGTTTDPEPAVTVIGNLDTSAGYNELARVGLGAASTANAFGSNGWNLGAFASGSDYVGFSLAPASGYQVTLTSLSWAALNGSNTGPLNGRWGYSIGGGAFTYQTDFNVTFVTAAGSWDFADIVDETQEIEFRYWAWGPTSVNGSTSSATGSSNFRNGAGNDIILNGSIATIPEPGVLVLLSFGGLAVLRFARRRQA